jgi:hypothetical protein
MNYPTTVNEQKELCLKCKCMGYSMCMWCFVMIWLGGESENTKKL